MTVLLDTCVVIDIERFEHGLIDEDEQLAVSAVTVAEMAYGLDTGDPAEQEARAARLQDVLQHYEVIPFGVEEAKLYGVLATLVVAAGRNPRPRRLDLQIAATAAAARIPLLTVNIRDFVGIDRLVDVVEVGPRAAGR